MKSILILFVLFISTTHCTSQHKLTKESDAGKNIITGADQTEKYLPLLRGKRIGILGNQTTIIGKVHLVDSLQKLGINIVKVFGPEHGFRGNASAGVKVEDEIDSATRIPIISLYGSKNKPSKQDMADVDVL